MHERDEQPKGTALTGRLYNVRRGTVLASLNALMFAVTVPRRLGGLSGVAGVGLTEL